MGTTIELKRDGRISAERQKIRNAIQAKRDAIDTLEAEIIEYKKQDILLCDDAQWFTEEMETVTYRKDRKKVSEQHLMGRIHWNETFTDEDDPDNKIVVERSRLVRVDGEWQ